MRGPLISYYLSISSPGSRYKRIPRVSYFAHQLPPSQQDIGHEARASGTPRVGYLPGQDAGYHVRPSATIYLSPPASPCRPGAARQLLRPSATRHGRIEDTWPARQLLSIYLFPYPPPLLHGGRRASATPPVSYPAREDRGLVSYYLSIYLSLVLDQDTKRIPRVSYFAHQLPPSQQDIGYEAPRQVLRASATCQGRMQDTTSARQLLSIYPPPPLRVGRAPRVSYSARQLPGTGG